MGRECYRLAHDPSRLVIRTDHPNGGSFLAYPQIIGFLMDRTLRRDVLKTRPPEILQRSSRWGIERQYPLKQTAITTRADPARILGLKDKGHLGPGADADITIYTPNESKEMMSEMPRGVIKSGEVLVEQGEIRKTLIGKTPPVSPNDDLEVEPDIEEWFEKYDSIQWRNDPVDLSYLSESCVIPTKCIVDQMSPVNEESD